MQRVFEESGDEIAISVHLDAIPTRIRDHHCSHTLVDCVIVGRHMDTHQLISICYCVVLVDPFCGSTITNKMLRRS